MKKYVTPVLSLLLALTLCFSVYSVYDGFSSSAGFLVGAVTILTVLFLFGLCRYTEKHRLIGGALIVITLLCCFWIFRLTAISSYYRYGQSFIEWLLSRGSEVEGAGYLWTLYVLFTAFFSFTVYYFSNVLYRMFFLTLVSLIPAVLYVKVLSEMDNVFLVLTVLLNVAIFISYRKGTFSRGSNPFFGNTLIAGASFILLTFLVTAMVPKNTETPYYDVFEDTFLGGDTSSPIGEDFSQLSSFSGDAGGFFSLEYSNRKLYTVVSEGGSASTVYLKRQNFDYYDFEEDRWYADSFYQSAAIHPSAYEDTWKYVNLPALQAALKAAESYEPGFLERYGLADPAAVKLPESRVNTLRIKAENFSAFYYLAPTQSLGVSVRGNERYYVSGHGAFYRVGEPHAPDVTYTASVYDEEAGREIWRRHGGVMTDGAAYDVLAELYRILSANEDGLLDVADAFLRMQEDANRYRQRCEENTAQISPEIRELAASLTEGCADDYEKAEALKEYFHTGGFVYDLEYRPRDDSPEYFLFTSKRGSCSDYASAYTLLARAAGLTVRYAEGYVLESVGRPGAYVIKSRDSHAYPEVFIPNEGWVVFEPTVARMDAMEDRFSLLNFISNLKMDYGLVAVVIGFMIIGMVLTLAVRFLMPYAGEAAFRLRLLTLSCDGAVVAAYNRLVRKARRAGLKEAPSKTPYELACFVQSIGCDLMPLAIMAEKVLYGGGTLSPAEKAEVRSRYRAASMALFRYRHRKREPGSRHKPL